MSGERSSFGLQFLVFFLVCAAFRIISITQPALPVHLAEFATDETRTSFTISAVILGITMSGYPHRFADWMGVAALGAALLLVPLLTRLAEMYQERRQEKCSTP